MTLERVKDQVKGCSIFFTKSVLTLASFHLSKKSCHVNMALERVKEG